MELTEIKEIACPRCGLVIDGYDVRITPADGRWVCPRCCKDLDYGSDITKVAERGLVLGSTVKDEGIKKEFRDLLLMMENWTSGYIRVLQESGLDWSSPHDFFMEFWEHMCPYFARLHATGHTTPDLMRAVGDKLVWCVQEIILACEQEEDILRLTGRWTDSEQEIKDYWGQETRKIAEAASCRVRSLALPEDTDT